MTPHRRDPAESANAETGLEVVVHEQSGTELGSVGDWDALMTFDQLIGLLLMFNDRGDDPS